MVKNVTINTYKRVYLFTFSGNCGELHPSIDRSFTPEYTTVQTLIVRRPQQRTGVHDRYWCYVSSQVVF